MHQTISTEGCKWVEKGNKLLQKSSNKLVSQVVHGFMLRFYCRSFKFLPFCEKQKTKVFVMWFFLNV